MRAAMRTLIVAALILGVVAAITGCGSSDDSTVTIEASDLSKAQWIKQAEAICIKNAEPILGRVSEYEEKNAVKSQRGNEKIAGQAIRKEVPPVMSQQLEELRALGAPAGDEEQIEAYLLASEKDIDDLENGSALSSLNELGTKFHRSGKLITQYGAATCAYG